MIINIAGGTGIMGEVHKPILEGQGHKVILSGRKTNPDLIEAAKMSDLTIISVPIPYTEETIKLLAPYCSAIMDFTSVKKMPLEWMIKYSQNGCEVGGLHPLYKKTGTTMVYCPTSLSGKKCGEIVRAFRNSGLEIKTLDPKDHDIKVNGMQVLRTRLLESFALVGIHYTKDIEELYSTSTTQGKLLLDLIGRQVGEDNDELFYSMREFNPYVEEMEAFVNRVIMNPDKTTPSKIRGFCKNKLEKAQQRASKHLD